MPQIRLGKDGVPLREDLESLSEQEWGEWIRARQSDHDAFTGQTLRDCSDGLDMIRSAVVRLKGTPTAARFAEASAQLLRDEVRFFAEGNVRQRRDQERCVQRAFVLAFFFSFLATIPDEIMEASQTFLARSSDCLRLLERQEWAEDEVGWDTDAYLYLILSCMWFLQARHQRFPRSKLEFWLRHTDTAEAARQILA